MSKSTNRSRVPTPWLCIAAMIWIAACGRDGGYAPQTATGAETDTSSGPPRAATDAETLAALTANSDQTYYVDPQQGNDGWDGRAADSGGGNTGPWATLDRANRGVRPGATILLKTGVYDSSIAPVASGEANNWITYAAAPDQRVVLRRVAQLEGRNYIRLHGLEFISPTGDAWIRTNQSSGNIQILNCFFDATTNTADSFGGLYMHGNDYLLRGNRFHRWRGDMIYATEVQRLLIEDNDFSQAAGEHAILTVVGSNVVIRNNYFRNPWDRVLHVTWNLPTPSRNVLVENNLFIDSDWDGKTNIPIEDKGASEVIRFLASNGIFRNNLIIGNHQGKDWDIYGTMSFQTFNSGKVNTDRYEHLRIYNNTFFSNRKSAMIFTKNTPDIHAEDNKFVNNIIANSDGFLVAFVAAEVPWRTYRFESNVLFTPSREKSLFLAGPGEGTFPDAEKGAPDVFADNIFAAPRFANAGLLDEAKTGPHLFKLSDIKRFYDAFQLADGSPGDRAAAPLTTVAAAASNSTRLRVADAQFFCDGYGLIDGDELLIGNETRTVVGVQGNDTLVLNEAVSAPAGTPVTLRRIGPDGDVGIYPF